MTRITRVEVITNNGREYVSWEDDNDITYMLQDSNRTLKVFVGKAPPEQPITEEENERYFEEAKQIVEKHFAKKKMTEIEKTKKEIEVLTKKLSFLEELEKTKSPVEEAFKRVYGVYPTNEITYNSMWGVFQKGYYAAQEEVKKLQEKDWEIKVETDYRTGKARHKTRVVDKDGNDYKPEPLTTEELLKPKWEPKPQNENEVAEGLKSAFREAVKQGVVSSVDEPKESWMDKPIDELVDKLMENPPDCLKFQLGKTLEQIITRWWEDTFTTHEKWSVEECIDDLIDQIHLWFPKEQSAEGSQDIYAVVSVEAHNDLLKKIKSKLRNKKDT